VPKRPRPGGRLAEPVVLVVEDEFLIAMDLELLLGQNGWRVLGPAPTVEVALELLNEEIPDVAILDINVRGKRITAVAEDLRRMGVPFMVASAYSRADIAGLEVLAEAPWVAKPFSERSLLAALAQLMNTCCSGSHE
jgi:two-component system, response regulator PdtaR